MDREEFIAVRSRVIHERGAYGGLDLEGMIFDLDHGLWSAGLLVHYIKNTGNPQCMLRVACTPGAIPSAQAGAALENAWLEDAAFSIEAHFVEEHGDQLLLDFVTWWGKPGGRYATGRVVVDLSHSASGDPLEGGDAIVP